MQKTSPGSREHGSDTMTGGIPKTEERAADAPDAHAAETTALPLATRTFCRGVLHAIGMFDPAAMTEEEQDEDPAEYRTWFCLGETCMAALLALNIAVPAFFWFTGIAALPLAFAGAAIIFLPLFVFVPKIIRYAVKADTDAVLEAFGKNEQVKKVFWALFVATAGLVLAEVMDPAMAERIVELIAGIVP